MRIPFNRLALCYTVVACGVVFYILRRIFFPSFFELEGVPFGIAAPSLLNSCYTTPSLLRCSDLMIVLAAITGVTLVAGWGHPVSIIFSLLLALIPTLFFLMLGPIWFVLVFLLINPLLVIFGRQLLFPFSEN